MLTIFSYTQREEHKIMDAIGDHGMWFLGCMLILMVVSKYIVTGCNFFLRIISRTAKVKRICGEQNEQVIAAYYCDPSCTDVIKKTAVTLYSEKIMSVDEIVHVVSDQYVDVYRKDRMHTEDGMMRVHVVETVVRLWSIDKVSTVNRLLVWD